MRSLPLPALLFWMICGAQAKATDWPMWRADAGRTAAVAAPLAEELQVLWSRQLGALTPAFRDLRLQFDRGHEPIVLGKRLFVASSREDSLTAYDTESGAELWRVYADGPVRFAPAAAGDRVIFGSDDGWLRCVEATTGKPLWTFHAVPSNRQLLGNGRVISVWPIRGGPVIQGDRIYFAAGVWPLEGVFIYCLELTTGKVVWLNDRTGSLYGVHPHQAEAFGGVAPQGYLLIDGADLVVPSSSAYPARLDLQTGALKEFALPKEGRTPGGWFASTPDEKAAQKLKRRGLLFDSDTNNKRHEDKPRQEGLEKIRRSLRVQDREIAFDSIFPGVTGKVHSVIAADEKCFVVTEEGQLYALAAKGSVPEAARHWPREEAKLKSEEAMVGDLLKAAGIERGHAVVVGLGPAGFLESLADRSHLKILALAPEGESLIAVRQRLSATWLQGERVSLRQVDPVNAGLPPYFANLIAVPPGTELPSVAALRTIYSWLRPYGGKLVGPASLLKLAEAAQLPKAELSQHPNGLAIITRQGALEGSTNYNGDWQTSQDLLVKAPLGVLWFDDALGNFKRAPQPRFIDGVMVSTDKNWLDASTRGKAGDYRLLPPVFSDVYTGRILDPYEATELRQRFAKIDLETVQPSQYRPPTQKDAWNPGVPSVGTRINPLTGESEPRVFPKSYGCDGGFDYGRIYTMRSGTAAFYDKQVESGTIHISGPRSGCTNSIVPANGVLNVPYYYEGCTCSYPLPMALALVSLPPTFEQWTAWGKIPASALAGKLQRLGVNFGAPGDRKTDDGTLWLEYPSVGGPSPEIQVLTDPPSPEFYYHHSVWIEGGEGWPWVAASGCQGLKSVVLSGFKPGTYTVRLVFAEPDPTLPAGARQFDVRVQDQLVLENYEVRADAGGPMRAVTKTFAKVAIGEGTLRVVLAARTGQTLLSGIEIIHEGLPIAPQPSPARVPGRQ